MQSYNTEFQPQTLFGTPKTFRGDWEMAVIIKVKLALNAWTPIVLE